MYFASPGLDEENEDGAYVCAPHWASIAEILSHPPELSGPDWQRGWGWPWGSGLGHQSSCALYQTQVQTLVCLFCHSSNSLWSVVDTWYDPGGWSSLQAARSFWKMSKYSLKLSKLSVVGLATSSLIYVFASMWLIWLDKDNALN